MKTKCYGFLLPLVFLSQTLFATSTPLKSSAAEVQLVQSLLDFFAQDLASSNSKSNSASQAIATLADMDVISSASYKTVGNTTEFVISGFALNFDIPGQHYVLKISSKKLNKIVPTYTYVVEIKELDIDELKNETTLEGDHLGAALPETILPTLQLFSAYFRYLNAGLYQDHLPQWQSLLLHSDKVSALELSTSDDQLKLKIVGETLSDLGKTEGVAILTLNDNLSRDPMTYATIHDFKVSYQYLAVY
jgi:hypothetical protein